ncbi:MAG: FAD-dependent oxidoreductase [Steroidobacteraceae bacterium]|jgi:glycine/D-amino acid oxidase-like deaminating enzyme
MANLYAETASPAPAAAPLEADVRADVAVVGGGITGLSTALHAARSGASVVLLEAEDLGFGASGRNGGQVNPGLKLDPNTVERDFGADLGARMNILAGSAPALVFELVKRHGIDCDARQNGTLRAAVHARHAGAIRRTFEQLERRGAPVELLEGEALARATGTDRYSCAMLDRRGGDLHPLRYARGLARAAIDAGARVHAHTRVCGMKRTNGGWRLDTGRASVTAMQVVLASNGYTDPLWPGLRRTVVPIFGAIAASAPLSEAARRSILPHRPVLYESGNITVYYRIDSQHRLLIGGRGPIREVLTPAEIPHLTRYAARLWRVLDGIEWTHAWGGRLAMTRDHYPHVHEPAPGVIICLGYNGRGVAMATAMGRALAGRMAHPSAVFDMPLTPLTPIPLHAFWPLAVKAAILTGRARDFLGI